MKFFQRFFCLTLCVLMLALSACSAGVQSGENQPDKPDNSQQGAQDLSLVQILDATSNVWAADSRTVARCAVDHLRKEIPEGRWFSADVFGEVYGSKTEKSERFLNLILQETSDITGVNIRWYQGGTSAEDVVAEKEREYLFYIQASVDGKEWETIYPADFDTTQEYARSHTGAEEDFYACTATGVNYVRVVGAGCVDPVDSGSNRYFAIRSVSLSGEMKGEGGGNPTATFEALSAKPFALSNAASLQAKRPVTVYFVRHAKSDYTISTNATAPLTEAGSQEADRIVSYFYNNEIVPDAIYTSPYRRCIETLDALADVYGQELIVLPDSYERTISSEGEQMPEGLADAQWADYEYKLVGGESLAEVEVRMARSLGTVFEDAEQKEMDTVVVSTHATALSTLLNCYQTEEFSGANGARLYKRILSMKNPCVKCIFDGNSCIYMEFMDLGA